MAYYKVLIKEEFVYEVLVSADTVEDANTNALTGDMEWGEPIHIGSFTYDIVELQEKKHETT